MGDVYSAFIQSLMILSIYFSWRIYRKENVSVFVSIALSAAAAILLFFGDINGEILWSGEERLCEFVWLLWSIWIAGSLLWAFSLNRAKREKDEKRYLMMAWLVSLLIFGCFRLFLFLICLPLLYGGWCVAIIGIR